MAAVAPIRVEGLRELQRELKNINDRMPRQLQKANKEAAELVAGTAKASFLSRPGVAPKVAPSVKALAGQRSASVKIGGDAYPYAMGSEFGSIRYKQFPAWRGSDQGAGYSLFPAIRDKRDEVVDRYAELIDALTFRAFPGH